MAQYRSKEVVTAEPVANSLGEVTSYVVSSADGCGNDCANVLPAKEFLKNYQLVSNVLDYRVDDSLPCGRLYDVDGEEIAERVVYADLDTGKVGFYASDVPGSLTWKDYRAPLVFVPRE